jgi:hypothetical protein
MDTHTFSDSYFLKRQDAKPRQGSFMATDAAGDLLAGLPAPWLAVRDAAALRGKVKMQVSPCTSM